MERTFMILKSAHLAIASLALALVLALAPASHAQEAPKGNKGFKTTKSQVVELGPEIAGMEGRQLRLRLLTIEPGGYIEMNSNSMLGDH